MKPAGRPAGKEDAFPAGRPARTCSAQREACRVARQDQDVAAPLLLSLPRSLRRALRAIRHGGVLVAGPLAHRIGAKPALWIGAAPRPRAMRGIL